jgi:uncharacterized protein YjbI with pentapeptide repeats
MSDQDNGQVSTLQPPATNDPEAWRAYWKAQGWPWRTEPEISKEQQKYLTERRAVTPNIEKSIYPFKDIKLSRADVEWLLATHENGRGPIDWSDEHQRKREGLDLRGADLSYIDLNSLPLPRLRGSLTEIEWNPFIDEPRKREGVFLEKADLRGAHLEGATFRRANLREASLSDTYLQEADLESSHLEFARLRRANLEGASLRWAHLEYSHLRKAILKNADLRSTHLEGTFLSEIVLWDEKHIGPQLADVHWEGANLSVVEWSKLRQLGDEHKARKKYDDQGVLKSKAQVLEEYETAVRANRQLAIALQNQGLNEDASYFAYRSQKLQRIVLRHQKKFGQYLFSGFLDLLAGYGYRPGRSVIWYLVTICVFALAYHVLGGLSLYPPDAFVFSIMSFHGRGFFPALSQETNLHNPLVMLASLEAIIGLLIEISFIATFTQRFFGR